MDILPTVSMNVSSSTISKGDSLLIAELCIFIFMNVLALFGNLLVCVAFYRSSSLRTVTNYFILSLAVSDLSMAVFVMPLKSASTLANKWVAGEIGCKVEYFFVNSSAGVSLLTVMLLAVNRYFRVGQPNLYAVVYSTKRSVIMAASAWLLTVALQFFLALITGLQFKMSAVLPTNCIQIYPRYSVSVFVIFIQSVYIVIPSLIIIFCYIKIYRTIRRHNKKTPTTLSQRRRCSAYGVEERKITQVLTVVVVGFYICWIPVLVTNILNYSQIIGKAELKYSNFYITFPLFASSIINPIIYATMSQVFRKEFIKIFQALTGVTRKFELV